MVITIETFLSFIVGKGKKDTTTNLFVLQCANEMTLQSYTLKFLKYTIHTTYYCKWVHKWWPYIMICKDTFLFLQKSR